MCILFCTVKWTIDATALQASRCCQLAGSCSFLHRFPLADACNQQTFMSLHVECSSSCALSFALRTTRRSSSLSLSDEPIRNRLAPFFWLELLLELLPVSESEESSSELGSARNGSVRLEREHGRTFSLHPEVGEKSGPRVRQDLRSSPLPWKLSHLRSPPRSSSLPKTWRPARRTELVIPRVQQSDSNGTRNTRRIPVLSFLGSALSQQPVGCPACLTILRLRPVTADLLKSPHTLMEGV